MTNYKTKTGLLALAATLAVASAGAQTLPPPSNGQPPLKVGIIDSPVERILGKDRGVTYQNQTFLTPGMKPGKASTAIHQSHGTVVASSFVEQARQLDRTRPIEIYAAQAFYQLSTKAKVDSEGNELPKPIALDYAAATRSLDWFKKNDVKIVVTAFITSNNPEMGRFMNRAKELGIVVFAGTNNDPVKFPPFPARHPDAIAVTGTNENLDYRWNRSMGNWVQFKAEGHIPKGYSREEVENGSSFAVARAAAYGSYIAAANPTATRDLIMNGMRAASQPDAHGVTDLSEWKTVQRFLSQQRGSDHNEIALLHQQRSNGASQR